jgi:hypothetical protein
MSEAAEKISDATAPADAPEPPKTMPPKSFTQAQGPHAHFSPGSRYRKLLLIPALGATFGFMAGLGVYSELSDKSIEFALLAVVMALGAYVLREPREIWRGKASEESHSRPQERSGIWALAAAAGGIFVEAALDHSLDSAFSHVPTGSVVAGVETLKSDGLVQALAVLLSVGLVACCLMHFWVKGARSKPRQARSGGGAVGAIAGIAVCLIGWALVEHYSVREMIEHHGVKPWWLIVAAALSVGWFLGPALAGGWAIDRSASGSTTMRMLPYLGVFSAVYVVLLLLVSHLLKARYSTKEIIEWVEHWAWLPIAAVVGQNIGWMLGLYRHRELCDSYLGSAAAVPDSTLGGGSGAGAPAAADVADPPSERKSGLLVDFPRPEGAPPLQASEMESAQTRGERAKDMLLRPKGDRLWASGMLVIALIGAGFAFYLGTLRGDPAILVNIAENFQLDSGLSNKGLQVYSEGRIVTITGRVDSEAEHAKAVREVISVRGVKQLIDQIKVAPATPPASTTISSPAGDSAQPLVPVIDATISIGGATGKGGSIANGPAANGSAANAKSSRSQKPAATAKAAGSQKAVETPKTAEAPKHKGLLNFLKKDKNDQASATDAKKTADTPKTPDAEKHKGLFNFLKKDKDKNNNGNKNVTPVPNNKNDKSNKNPKKEVTKNPAVH